MPLTCADGHRTTSCCWVMGTSGLPLEQWNAPPSRRCLLHTPSLMNCHANCHAMPWLTPHCLPDLFAAPLVVVFPWLLSIGVGVVTIALVTPRPCEGLSQDSPAPGVSLCCPDISLTQETPLYTEFCHSAADHTGSRATPLCD